MFYPLTFYENVDSAGNINNTKITTNITIIGASSFVLACSPFLLHVLFLKKAPSSSSFNLRNRSVEPLVILCTSRTDNFDKKTTQSFCPSHQMLLSEELQMKSVCMFFDLFIYEDFFLFPLLCSFSYSVATASNAATTLIPVPRNKIRCSMICGYSTIDCSNVCILCSLYFSFS